jgi:hypothetical protein
MKDKRSSQSKPRITVTLYTTFYMTRLFRELDIYSEGSAIACVGCGTAKIQGVFKKKTELLL